MSGCYNTKEEEIYMWTTTFGKYRSYIKKKKSRKRKKE